MKQQLLDIIEHTVFACSVEHVRICANGIAHIHAFTPDKQVVVYGHCNTPPEKCYGIADNGELYALLSNPSLSLVSQNDNLLTFKNTVTGNEFVYSLITEKRISELVDFDPLHTSSKIDYEVIFDVTDKFVDDLKYQRKRNSDLRYMEYSRNPQGVFFGFYGKSRQIFDEETGYIIGWESFTGNINVQNIIKNDAVYTGNQTKSGYKRWSYDWSWPIKTVIKILDQKGKMQVKVSPNGVMTIICKTDFATYCYLLPVHSR